jgi:transposase-like protein
MIMSRPNNFLKTAAARTLSLASVMRMTDEEAFAAFSAMRWPETDGAPICPVCGCVEHYTTARPRTWKCKGCTKIFTVTTDTLFHARKMAMRDILAAIALFVNGASGTSALRLSRELNIQHKTAFVLLHKLREAMAADAVESVGGAGKIVEVDGAYFGGYVKPENKAEDRKDLRLKENQSGKRQAVVVLRERRGRTLAFVAKSEGAAVNTVVARIEGGSQVHADEATVWDELHNRFDARRVNHSVCFWDDGACTNWAESYFSRLRRAEVGVHHHISGRYLQAYASEMAWREDHRRQSNGAQFNRVATAALALGKSKAWRGYWQR